MIGGSASVHVDGVRRLGARVTFLPHEWLPSALRRVGYACGASANDIMQWCGLPTLLNTKSPITTFVNDAIVLHLVAGLGVDADTVATMVMSHLPDQLVAVRTNGTVAQSRNWTRGAGTRYCPDCLRENPGVFYTYWRLWWCFLCERHNTILRDVCPACHGELVEAAPREQLIRDPMLCWAELPDGGPCMHPLDRSWSELTIDESSPVVAAQQCLSGPWAERPQLYPEVPASTLRGAAIALLGAGNIERIANLAGVAPHDVEGLFDTSARIGTSPPKDAFAMAALLGAAYRIVIEDEELVAPIIRSVTYERAARTDQYASAPWSARNFLDTWPGVDAALRRRILRTLDEDLSPIQRLVHGSAASKDVAEGYALIRGEAQKAPDRRGALAALMNSPDAPTSATWGLTAVPELLWTSWAAPLGVDDHTDGYTLQGVLADAVRIAGTGAFPDYEAIAGIGRRLRPNMFGTPTQTTSILRQISELAIALRASPGPIDYKARRALEFKQLLPEDHWRVVAESVAETPGRQRRLLNAQRYAYMRITAIPPSELPEQLKFRQFAPDAADYTAFVLTMSAELKSSIDAYLAAWLARFEGTGTTGPRPVTWTPPRFLHADADIGPELNDIDIDTLHTLRADGETSARHMAAVVGRSARHVRWAVAEHPLPTGAQTEDIDWASRLRALPDRIRTMQVNLAP